MIRQIRVEDYEKKEALRKKLELDLSRLNNIDYRVEIQRKGFLPAVSPSKEDLEKDINKIWLVNDENGEITASLRIDEEQELMSTTIVSWLKPELKDVYFSQPHASVGFIGVDPNAQERGVGTALLKAAIEKIKAKGIDYLFSFVVLSPLTNFPSMMWHEKNGFERVAVSSPHPLFGMENYQSFLYGRKL